MSWKYKREREREKMEGMEEDAFIKNDTNKYESEKSLHSNCSCILANKVTDGERERERFSFKNVLVFNDGGRVSACDVSVRDADELGREEGREMENVA